MKQAQTEAEQEAMMTPVAYGDPATNILDAFDRFESGDANESLGADDPLANQGLEEEVVPPAKEPTKEPVKETVEDGDIDEEFFKPAPGTEESKVKEEEKTKDPTTEEFDAETERLAADMSKTAKDADSKSQYDRFKELREELKVAKVKTVTPEVETKLAQLEEKEILIQQLNERITEMSLQDAQRLLLNGPEYEEQCAKPAARIFAKAEVLAKAHEGDVQFIKDVLLEPDPAKRSEMINTTLDALSPTDKVKVELWADEFDTLRAVRAELLAGADKKVAQFEQRRMTKQQEELTQHKQAVHGIANQLFEKYLPIIPGLTDEKGKPTQIYKELKASVSNIDFTKAMPKDLAFAAFAGTVVQHLNRQVRELSKKLEAYKKGDVEESRADPGLGAGGNPHSKPSSAKTIVELADEMLGG